jgi:hypothetical protein
MPADTLPLDIALPPLSDEAAVELLDLFQDLLLAFESHYASQILRHYHSLSYENTRKPLPPGPPDDPPF